MINELRYCSVSVVTYVLADMFLVFFRLCTYVEYNVEVHVRTYVFTVYNVYISRRKLWAYKPCVLN